MTDINDDFPDDVPEKPKRTAEEKAARKDAKERQRVADLKAADNDYTYYVHLANGEVHRVKEKDLPGHFGADPTAPHGHFITGGHVHVVTGVYPREIKEEVKK